MTVHDFSERLAYSHAQSDQPWWRHVYEEAFAAPGLAGMADVRQDGWAQRGGIDRVLTLADGTTLTVDEKVRERDYGDICLEYLSDERRRKRGWVCKDLTCDYIAYAVVPSATCYLLPFQLLRRAWRQKGRDWVRRAKSPAAAEYRLVRADNGSYTTLSVAVPIPVVLVSIGAAMVVNFEAVAA